MNTEAEVLAVGAPTLRREAAAGARWRAAAALLFFWLASAVYVLPFVNRGWIAHDEGTLAQSAERVLQGEMPHRDFDEGYTGGLTWVHALAFRVFGTNLRALRYTLFVFFLAFVPLVYAIARRALSPLFAGLVTLACVAWTLPNYFASMPSWYNLFLAALGAWALLKHVESDRLRWIFLAGLAAGASILVKIVGVYDVAAVFLFLAWREQVSAASRGSAGRSAAFAAVKTVLGALYVALLVFAFRARASATDVIHFVLPGAALTLLLVASEWREGRGRFGERARGILRLSAPFAAGVAIPLGLFVALYAAAGSLAALAEGLIVRPQRHVATSMFAFRDPWMLVSVLPFAALLAFPQAVAGRRFRFAAPVAALTLAGLLALGGTSDGYRWIWNSARSLDVVAVLVGCAWLWRNGSTATPVRRQQVFLLLALAACIGLVQYPFSSPIYFCYAVPFTVLALAFLAAAAPPRARWLNTGALLFYMAFAVLFMNRGYVYFLGGVPTRYRADGRLAFERGGLAIGASEAKAYNELVAEVTDKARGSEIFAGPEAPEVYFLCGKKNLTRIFFEGTSGIRPGTNTEGLRKVFDNPAVKVVVWNRAPQFTHGLWRVYREQLWARFPNSKEIGKYTVMWRAR
ncbi:MAG TPA: glycosyltransferase family 39 protein [Thermoanaerobaculia bacterium]|nr:glycosyltransferase family 39 protein [Thermoanaerobaculia bacterium]